MPDTGPADSHRPRAQFLIVEPDDPRLGGDLFAVEETAEQTLVLWPRGDATEDLAAELTAKHELILGEGHWHWHEEAQPLEAPPVALYVFDEQGLLPDGVLCSHAERKGAFVWVIRPPHMSERLRTRFNQWLANAVGSGRWQQHWDA